MKACRDDICRSWSRMFARRSVPTLSHPVFLMGLIRPSTRRASSRGGPQDGVGSSKILGVSLNPARACVVVRIDIPSPPFHVLDNLPGRPPPTMRVWRRFVAGLSWRACSRAFRASQNHRPWSRAVTLGEIASRMVSLRFVDRRLRQYRDHADAESTAQTPVSRR